MTVSENWLPFSKMHGLGNDFMVIALESLDDHPALQRLETWRALADRHTGVGFDQALVILPAPNSSALALYRIFNADGSEVEQCGNGARCVAEWLRLHNRCHLDSVIHLQSKGGAIEARFVTPGRVAVNMGEPRFPADPQGSLRVLDSLVSFTSVSMGNPHIVMLVDDLAMANVSALGLALETHPAFPQGTNVGFAQRVDRGHLLLRVHERGVGETRACGTGACAAMACGYLAGQLDTEVEVILPGGSLQIGWQGPGTPLWMTGEALLAYRGEIQLP
jgi:diaminopimelate epimerase